MILLQIDKKNIIKAIVDTFTEKMGLTQNKQYPYVFRNLTKPSSLTLLQDLSESTALLVQKIDLGEVFNFEIDISMFKENQGTQETDGITLLRDMENHTVDFTIDTIGYYGRLAAVDEDTTKCFNTFCTIYGIEGLTLFDVEIHRRDNILTIDVFDYHPFYKGTLEIKTW